MKSKLSPRNTARIVGILFIIATAAPLLSVRSLRSPSVLFSWLCVESYLLAMLALHLMVPNYTQVKASYALGLAPCFCVLLVAGLEQLRERWRRYAMLWLAMWALASYAAFFVIE